jgi:hypothetical protein
MPGLPIRASLNKSLIFISAAVVSFICSAPAHGSEGGASFYLLGSGGPGNAILPPFQGIYFDNTSYYYAGKAKGSQEFVVGGNVVAGLKAKIAADFATVLWVPSTNVLGGTLAVGGAFAVGEPIVKVNAVLTGPRGGTIELSAKDEKFIIGDPVVTAVQSWDVGGNVHVAASTMVNIPVGHYREDKLANLSFHRWIVDGSLGVSWHDAEKGWDVSSKAGITFNGTNPFTDYKTGTEFHFEGSVERMFSPAFSFGLLFYRFQQISGDSGPGATLGPNKGKVTGAGATAAYNFEVGHTPVTARMRLFTEFNVVRRLDGNAAMFSLSFPLKMKLPPAAAQAARQ